MEKLRSLINQIDDLESEMELMKFVGAKKTPMWDLLDDIRDELQILLEEESDGDQDDRHRDEMRCGQAVHSGTLSKLEQLLSTVSGQQAWGLWLMTDWDEVREGICIAAKALGHNLAMVSSGEVPESIQREQRLIEIEIEMNDMKELSSRARGQALQRLQAVVLGGAQ